MRHLLILAVYVFCSTSLVAEGTKQLRPTQADRGNLNINHPQLITGTNVPMYTNFGTYRANETEKIKIRVNSITETIYFGMNNKEINGGTDFIPNVPYRIKDPAGNIVFNSIMPNSGPGNIATYNEAVAGPRQLGNPAGYDALSINPAMTGDYVIEFDPPGAMDIHLFDVTVADADNNPINGRLHSQGWQISTESGSNRFNGKVFPYDPKGVVYEVDFNGMQPFTFVVNFNSVGTGNTGDYEVDRQSKKGKQNFSIPEFEVFLNPPDPAIYPTYNREVSFAGEAVGGTCQNKNYCLNFTSDAEGYLDGFIDINKNNVYDESTDIIFSRYFPSGSTVCVPWDGKDAQGNWVDVENIKIIASYGLSVTHLPVFDVEDNRGGLKVKVVSPAGVPDPMLFWDDSGINDNDNIDEKVNLTGCNSVSTGCHKWKDRGDNSNPETINTWWYTKVVFDTLVLNQPVNPPVNLSFDPASLKVTDTTVCAGDSLTFYIHNDGNHFNTADFDYTWFYNSNPEGFTGRNYKQKITSGSEIVIKATALADPTCVSYDTLKVDVVNPVQISAVVTDADCDGIGGAIQVNITDGPPSPQISWVAFPGQTNLSLGNISAGSYQLKIQDPAFSNLCALDTTFTVGQPDPVKIKSLDTTASLCYTPSGSAAVVMEDPAVQYEYIWNNAAPGGLASINNLGPGSHYVKVQNPVTGCFADSNFSIPSIPLAVSINTENEVCSNQKGWISLTTPGKSYFSIIFSGLSGQDTLYENLSAGSYSISVVAHISSTCRVDDNIILGNDSREILIDSLVVTPVICSQPTGSAEVFMPSDGFDYVFSWFGQPYSKLTAQSGLNKGTFPISVRINNSNCRKDTNFVISGSDAIEIDAVATSPSLCYTSTGTASVSLKDPGKIYEYNWNNQGFTTSSMIINQAPGSKRVIVREVDTGCQDDTTMDVASLPFNISVQTEDEVCHSGEGKITLSTPGLKYFDVWFDGLISTDTVFNHLATGNYTVEVIAKNDPACNAQASALISNVDRTVKLQALNVVASDCGKHSGSATALMSADNRTYLFNWKGQGPGVENSIRNLPIGTYSLQILEAGTACKLDTSFMVTATGFSFDLTYKDEICGAGNGSISVATDVPEVGIKWSDGFNGFNRWQMPAGAYQFTLVNPADPSCSVDSIVYIQNHAYDLDPDFTFYSTAHKGNMETGAAILFTNTTTEAYLKSAWDFGDGNTAEGREVQNSYYSQGTYWVTLTVADENGCSGSIRKSFDILERVPCEIALPNAFSPNGDNLNDQIGILGNAETVELKIFNRWGEVVFRTLEIPERWNGIYRGEEAPVGVYPFILNYECPDNFGNLVKKTLVGDISLIR